MKTIKIIDIGEKVVCDLCSEDYSESLECGGFLFQSKAVCPVCAPNFELNVQKFGETSFIRERCPEFMSFKDWVLGLRNGNNEIKIESF